MIESKVQKNKTFIKCNVIGNLTGVFLHKVLKIYSCRESRLRVEASEVPLKASYDPRIIANASQLSQKIETCVLYNILRVFAVNKHADPVPIFKHEFVLMNRLKQL